jgi:hypothetical protein
MSKSPKSNNSPVVEVEGTTIPPKNFRQYVDPKSGIKKVVIFESINDTQSKIVAIIIINGNIETNYVPIKEIIIDPNTYIVNDTQIDTSVFKKNE